MKLSRNNPFIEVVDNKFIIYYYPNGKVASISFPFKKTFSVGDEVISNGRFFIPKGEKGFIIEIKKPFKNGRTTNILSVIFPNYGIFDMKPKDLLL